VQKGRKNVFSGAKKKSHLMVGLQVRPWRLWCVLKMYDKDWLWMEWDKLARPVVG
jgi:hypothetical protein